MFSFLRIQSVSILPNFTRETMSDVPLVKMCSIAVIYSQINKEPMEHSWHKKIFALKILLRPNIKENFKCG